MTEFEWIKEIPGIAKFVVSPMCITILFPKQHQHLQWEEGKKEFETR